MYKLNELLILKYGKNQKDVESSIGYPIYGTSGIIGYASKYLYDKKSILFGRKGSISRVQFVDEPFWCVDTTFYSIINTDLVIPKYLYYKLSTIDFNSFNEGTTIPSLRAETLNTIEFEIHNYSEQQHIVNTIGSIDDLIEKYNTINDKISNISQLIVMKNLSSECKDGKVIDIATVNSGKTTKKLKDGKFEIIGANGCLGYTDNYNLSTNAIITGRVGTIGTFKQISEPVWCSDNTLIIKTMYFNFLFYYLKQYFDCNSLNRGSTQPLITQTDLLDYKIKIPSNIDILEKKLNEYYLLIKKNNDEINKLNILKQQYLKKFFG